VTAVRSSRCLHGGDLKVGDVRKDRKEEKSVGEDINSSCGKGTRGEENLWRAAVGRRRRSSEGKKGEVGKP